MGCNCRKKQLGQRGQCHSTLVVHMLNIAKHQQGAHSYSQATQRNSADLASMTANTKIWYQSGCAGLKGEPELEPVTNDGA